MAERSASALVSIARAVDVRRYSRHLLMPEVALEGQRKLAAARVLVVGAGGLGTPVLQYLGAAGVGTLGIVDDDVVELSNLQRQVLYTEADLGAPKAESAARRVRAANGDVAVAVFPVRLDAANARDLVRGFDIVVDATDSFGARYLINDAARLENKPDVYASIFRFEGQVSVFDAPGPCYRCVFPEPPPAGSVPSCAEGGVLGVLAGIVGTLQANEVLKLILGLGEPLRGRLALVDALGARVREIAFASDPACPLHGERPTIADVVAIDDEAPELGAIELAATDLDAYLDAFPATRVLDLRETRASALRQSVHVPASALDARLHELDSAIEYVVACRVGSVSRWAVGRLREAGFRRLRHLSGGTVAYAATKPRDAFDAW